MRKRSGSFSDRSAIDLAEYDRFRYDNFPFRATHPDWLGMVASLLGVNSAAAESCRVLELGCGRGGNLVGLAAALPGAEFVGVDHAPSQIAEAKDDAAGLGLGNVSFLAADIASLGDDLGVFDYVICHGVYSWVSERVQDRILELSRSVLAPSGIAFVSFNTLPGWSARRIVRDMLRRWVPEGPADSMAASARELLALWGTHTPENGPLAAFIQHEIELLGRLSDKYLYFEHLVEHNQAFRLEEFVASADRFGLSYLGDADVASMTAAQLGDEGQAAVEALGLEPIAVEQLLDDMTVRFFRRALLCRDVDRPSAPPDHRVLHGAWVSGDMTIDELSVDLDAGGGGTIDLALIDADGAVLRPDDPHTAALLWVIAEHRPVGLPVVRVAVEAAARLGVEADAAFIDESLEVLHALVLRGRLDVGRHHRGLSESITTAPRTTPLARYQASKERRVITTGRHEHFAADRMDIVLLRSLDGEHGHDDLVAEVRSAQATGELEVTIDDESVTDELVLAELVGTKLERFRLAGLLVDTDAGSAT